jgi:hypothetical protein
LYPNSSVFIWVSHTAEVDFNDFHAAVPDKYARIPAVSTRIGDSDSTGKYLAIKLTKKLNVPVVVSWSLPDTLGSSEIRTTIENQIFQDIKDISSKKQKPSPSVIGA